MHKPPLTAMHIHVNPEVDSLTGGRVATKEMLSGITKLATQHHHKYCFSLRVMFQLIFLFPVNITCAQTTSTTLVKVFRSCCNSSVNSNAQSALPAVEGWSSSDGLLKRRTHVTHANLCLDRTRKTRRFCTHPFDLRAKPAGLVFNFPPQLPH